MTRVSLFLCTALASFGVGYPGLTPMPIKLMWNASASAPIGFYTIDFDGLFEVTDLVAIDAPEPLADFLDKRGYLPKGVPLLKRVLAVSGQVVCRTGLVITVDGVDMGHALERDRAGRDLPEWQGCQRIQTGEFFAMNWQVEGSRCASIPRRLPVRPRRQDGCDRPARSRHRRSRPERRSGRDRARACGYVRNNRTGCG